MTELVAQWALGIAGLFWLLAIGLSGAQVALTQVDADDAQELADQGGKYARVVAQRSAGVSGLLAIRIALEFLAVTLMGPALFALVDSRWVAGLLTWLLASAIGLLLVRLAAQKLAARNPAVALRVVWPIIIASIPIGRALPLVVEDKLADLVERMEESEELEDEDRELVRSVFDWGNRLTREIMVPRTDMVTIQQGTTVAKAFRLFAKSGFSRVPVVGDDADDIQGVLYLKDVLKASLAGDEAQESSIRELIRPAQFLPESKPVDDLMRHLQSSSTHIAIVIDEYGGVAGLVTIEDAIEEIVGELVDEHDASVATVEELEPGRFRVPARLPLVELGELFHITLEDSDVDTAAGLLAKAIGKVPLPGSQAEVDGIDLLAERAEGRRRQVATIIVTRVESEPDQTDQEDPK